MPDIRIRPSITAVIVAVLATCAVARAQSLDTSFNPGANGTVNTLAVQADGKILVGGAFTTLGGGGTGTTTRNYVGRLNAAGSLDTSFDPGTNGEVLTLAVQPDGKILVGGNFTALGGGTGTMPRNYLGRLNADGSPDPSFDPGANARVGTFAVQPDGKILVGGYFTMLGGGGTGTTPRNYIGRLNADGSLDTSFDPGAGPGYGWVGTLALQADGKILVGGYFTALGGGGTGTTPRNYVGRLNADGSVDTGFNPGASDLVSSVAVQADGKILIGGNFGLLGGGGGTTLRQRIGRVNEDGSVDPSFDPGANLGVSALVVQPDGRILVGGAFSLLGGGFNGSTTRNCLGRLNADGSLDVSFNPGANRSVNAFVAQADGKILVGGNFTTLGGGGTGTTTRRYLGRLAVDAATSAPSVTTQPSNQTVAVGATASFSAAASGSTAVQWQVSTNGGATWTDINIVSATTTTYRFAAAAGDSATRYRAVFTNSVGSVATDAATLTVMTAPAVGPPFGAFDTPADGATGLQGSFAVTGWALDDALAVSVEIWRDLVPGEPPSHAYTTDPSHPAYGKVFVAYPLFVTGSRPDVEAAYPNYARANQAGWGYLLLSQGLWAQGNGSFTLHAYAFDSQGHHTLLGSKTIAVDNAHAVKPFGALDTPTYGGTVSGSFWNYGWALTPNATPPCTITNGNVLMGIDSGPLVPVSYGDLRTDVAAAFPGLTNSSGAGGAYYLDTTTLADGMHQIGWLVTDNCGRQDGIGSRFFTVLNGGARPGSHAGGALSEPANAGGRVEGGRRAPASASARDVTRGFVRPDLRSDPISVRQTGGEWQSVLPNADGWHVIEVPQDGRIEVQLPLLAPGPYRGFQDVAGERRPMPLGSSFDAKAGIFYWQPAAGYLGRYELVFEATSGVGAAGGVAVRVRVVVGPPMRAVIDTPHAESVVAQPFTLAGWALDLAATDGTGVDTVHVWAYPTDGREPLFLGVAAYGDVRPDVAAMYGASFAGAAYGLTVNGLRPGTYDVVVYPHRTRTNTFEGAQLVRVIVR